jgi:hypothetical protein
MGLSQVMNVGRWNMVLSDNVSYLPGTPTVGLSGIPGLGDLGVSPIQIGPDTGQGILSDYSTRVANTASGSIQRRITGKTSANGSGYYSYTHFLNSTASALGLDNTAVGGGGGVSHEFDQRNSIGANYSYSSYDFGSIYPGFVSHTATMSYTHQYSRKLTLSGAAGPQWTTIQTPGSKASLGLFVDASAAYAGHFSRGTLSYLRSTNSGYGVIGGTLSDGITFSVSRVFARVWSGSGSAAFTRSTSLPSAVVTPYSFHTYVASAQATRALARSLSIYTSFTLQDQSSNRTVGAVNVFSGRSEVIGFGITYSPTAMHFGRP